MNASRGLSLRSYKLVIGLVIFSPAPHIEILIFSKPPYREHRFDPPPSTSCGSQFARFRRVYRRKCLPFSFSLSLSPSIVLGSPRSRIDLYRINASWVRYLEKGICFSPCAPQFREVGTMRAGRVDWLSAIARISNQDGGDVTQGARPYANCGGGGDSRPAVFLYSFTRSRWRAQSTNVTARALSRHVRGKWSEARRDIWLSNICDSIEFSVVWHHLSFVSSDSLLVSESVRRVFEQ